VRRAWLAPVLGAMWLGAGPAAAHIALMDPPPRTDALKVGPCGAGGGARGTAVTPLRPGATITVKWEETVDHPGHFRIAFDEDGDDLFVDPAGFEDVSGGPGVLVDGIADRSGGGIYTQEITLPDVECDGCTLQVIQVMSDKPPYGDGNDMYYQCADLVLSADAEPSPAPVTTADDPPADDPEEGCGCRGSSGAAGLLVLPFARRRRRR
jgi:hypothetical protein